ncbi:FliH/SctL family protein [Marinomonas sp. 2405UD68-3]|uniref:FliH/SctL family protein n=1 Tax=Marinomonas sp. 2405UD68-3 TaxID=3391835 RepID=UPI0039C96B46
MSDGVNKEKKKLTAYERWELPYLQGNNNDKKVAASGLLIKTEDATVTYEEVDKDSLVYEPLTASQLEEIRSAAYEEGFSQGLEEGREKGREEGHSEGHDVGHAEGLDSGKKEGFEVGHNEAREQAHVQFEQVERQLKTIVEELMSPLKETRVSVELILYASIKRFVESITQIEINERSSHILKSQLGLMFDSIEEYGGKIKLTLNPDDLELLKDYQVFDAVNLHLESDDSLFLGGFILESKNFFVDGSIENRVKKVFDELELLTNQVDVDANDNNTN